MLFAEFPSDVKISKILVLPNHPIATTLHGKRDNPGPI